MGSGLSQESAGPGEGRSYDSPELSALIRKAASDSCVLLENDGTLPLGKDEPTAVFGRCQYDWFYVGYGSGGDVHAPYYVDLITGIKNVGGRLYEPLAEEYRKLTSSRKYKADDGFWGHWPFSHPEVPIRAELIRSAAENAKTAVVVIGRAAGEDRDNVPEPGSWFLTKAEKELLKTVTESFSHTVAVLNIGAVMDLSWIKDYPRLSAVLITWLGGQESGNAAAAVLYGDTVPSGRMPDTAARSLEDHLSNVSFGEKNSTVYSEGIFVGYRYFDKFAKDKVLYPFGYGLSYTDFSVSPGGAVHTRTGFIASVSVRNTGALAGKTSVLLFALPPKKGMDKPLRVLVAFGKTRELVPGEEQVLTLVCDNKAFSSFDTSRHAFVLEPGEYAFEANSVHVGGFTLNEEQIVERCHSLSEPQEELKERIEAAIPKEPLAPEGVDLTLADVTEKRASLDEFVADLSKAELEALTRGHGMMNSPLGIPGNAGVFGGVTEQLIKRGVPAVSCCDGPAGLRIAARCALIPCGTALAATFDTPLVEKLHEELAHEMEFFGADVRLAPGMNLHRHPLCGRNFEYFSEDPTLSGRMAAACVRGIAAGGKAACPKHFACNNQETARNINDSVVPERALRELYLRGFEICVRESMPDVIMTSYNKVNGVYSHYNFDLATTVLRGEWGFEGVVITDWWMKKGRSPEYPLLRGNAYRVRAQVDVLMPGDTKHTAKRYKSDGTLLKTLGKPGGITRAELMRSAKNALRVIIKLKLNKTTR